MKTKDILATPRRWARKLDTPLSQNIRNALVAVTFALVATIVGLSLWISQEHDRLALSSSRQMVEGGLDGLEQRHLSLTRHTAVSTDLYSAILEDDRDWIYANAASAPGTESDISVIIAPDGRADFGWRSDVAGRAPVAGLIPPETLALLNGQLDNTPVMARDASNTYARLGGDLWLLSMARVMPAEGIAPGTPDGRIPRLVMGKILSPELLAGLGAPFRISDLQLGSAGAEGVARHALRDANGDVLGHVTWTPPRPAKSVHAQIGPPLVTVTALTVILLGIAASQIVGSARGLEDALVRAQEANKAKSQFLATVSHELRTPVTSIKGSLELITSGALGTPPEQFAKIAGIAKNNSDRLGALIEDLLQIQKMESGTLDYHFKPIAVRQVVERAIRLTKPIADTAQVTITVTGSSKALHVRADQSRLEQVVTNILSNAIKFSHPGDEVLVEVENMVTGVRISVTDQGVGIPSESHDKIFAPFGQVDSSDTRAVGGTGLGLNIAKRIIEAHGGVIDYLSDVGNGSTFFIELDRVAAPAGKDAAATGVVAPQTLAPDQLRRARPHRAAAIAPRETV